MVSLLEKFLSRSSLSWHRFRVAFQVNAGESDSTGHRGGNSEIEAETEGFGDESAERDSKSSSTHHFHNGNAGNGNGPGAKGLISRYRPPLLGLLETIVILGCFALVAGQLPPDVNESHYLTKAKHFWNPEWCPGDIFLSSSFAHWIFYVATGWLTLWLPLSAVAWAGRLVTWALLAFAWRRLSWRVIPVPGFAVISALFFLLLNERFHLAGEWVVGGFEAKGLAYFFVLMALGNMTRRSWNWVWPALGAATAVHALVGGWALLAAIFVWVSLNWVDDERERWQTLVKRARSQWLPFSAGLALSMVGVIPPLVADQSATPEVAAAAHAIYVHQRIAHHLMFAAFPTMHVARFTLILLFCLLLNRWMDQRWKPMHQKLKPVFLFCLASLLISLGGLILSGIAEQDDQLAQTSVGLLRFYWFRLADFSLPMATAIFSTAVIWFWIRTDRRIETRLCCLVFVVAIGAAAGAMVFEKFNDPRPRADRKALPTYPGEPDRTLATYQNWRKVCTWIGNHTPPNAVFITPADQQTFKWYSGRAEVVSWKDVPQDAHGILEWRKRIFDLNEPQQRYDAGLMTYPDAELRKLASEYGATYMLVPQRQVDLAGEIGLKQVYPVDPNSKTTYVVFEF